MIASSIRFWRKASAIFLTCARTIALISGSVRTCPPSSTAASPLGPSTMS